MTNDNFIRRYQRHLRNPDVSQKRSEKLTRWVERGGGHDPRTYAAVIACAMRDIADQREHLLWNDRPH
jgi:hypothetical protein